MKPKSNSNLLSTTDKSIPPKLIAILKPTILLLCIIFIVAFMNLLLHEGGHALMNLVLGGKVDVLYVHPFALDGYVRPFPPVENAWQDAAGNLLAILVGLLLLIIFWKRRSLKTLPFVFLFPWTAIMAGIGIINLANGTGDYSNIIKLTGMSSTYFYVLDIVLIIAGIFFFMSLLPLVGLAPGDLRSLFIVPLSLFIWGLIGVMVAYLTVPGAPIESSYHLGASLIRSAKSYPLIGVILGVILAIIYLTLYRIIYRRLPGGLRTNTANLSWKDIRLPALLSSVTIIIGLILIT